MKLLRKTIMGVCALTCTAVTFTTATYAWWKNYTNATVQGLNITANSGLGFMVSVDGINYKNDLTADEIYGAMLVGKLPDKYGWKYDETIGKSFLCKIESIEIENDEQGNEINRKITYGDVVENPLSLMNEIELMPLTSLDGVNITDLYNSRYISKLLEIEENLHKQRV